MSKIKLIPIVAVLPLVVMACAGNTGEHKVFEAGTYYGAALATATEYESLPRCDSEVSGPCSAPSAVEKIRAADTTAFNALRLAKAAISDGDVSKTDEAVIDDAYEAVFGFIDVLSSFGMTVDEGIQ